MPIIEIKPHDAKFVESDWRTAINSFFRHGHEWSIKVKIGIDLVLTARIAGGSGPAPGVNTEKVLSLSKDYEDELVDRVLTRFSPSKLAIELENYEPESVPVETRTQFFTTEATDKKMKMPESNGDEEIGDSIPMIGRSVLILDSGRGDGLTEALCKCFCKLGAEVVLTFVCDDRHKDGAKAAKMILEKCKDMPGSIKMVEGVPYRSKFYTVQPSGVLFAEDLVDEILLHVLEAMKYGTTLDCLGKCTCRFCNQPFMLFTSQFSVTSSRTCVGV